MANLFDVYNDGLLIDHTEGAKLETGETPITISGLTADTTYDKVQVAYAGSYSKSDVPIFKTNFGRNFVLNSSGLNGSSTVRPTLIGASSGALNTTLTYQSDGILMTNGVTNTTKEWFYQVASSWTNFSDTPLTPGKQITFSADVMGTVPQAVLRYSFNGGTWQESFKSFDINNTSWTRISATVTPNQTNTVLLFRIQGGINNQFTNGWTGGETLKFRYVKIEEGNRPTTWIPAPEDSTT